MNKNISFSDGGGSLNIDPNDQSGTIDFGSSGTGGITIDTNPNWNGYVDTNYVLTYNTMNHRTVKETVFGKIFKLQLPEISKEEINVHLKHDSHGWYIEVTLSSTASSDFFHPMIYNEREYFDTHKYNLNSIEASYENGVLTIRVRKSNNPDHKSRKIEVE